jgi:hypothetical protein
MRSFVMVARTVSSDARTVPSKYAKLLILKGSKLMLWLINVWDVEPVFLDVSRTL